MEVLAPICFIKNPEDVKKMYISPINIRYIKSQIIFAVRELDEKSEINYEFLGFINNLVMSKNLVYSSNNITELHKLNKEIILSTAYQLINEPDMLDDIKRSNYKYSDYSFRGGKWHPEDLFLPTTSYYQPLEVRSKTEGKFDKFYGINIMPNEVFRRYYDSIENNGEDRRVNIPKRVFY